MEGFPIVDVDGGLLGHWRLKDDARDSSGNGNHGASHGVVWRDGAASFSGRGAYIEVPDDPSLHLGSTDFSIAVWVKTARPLDDSPGDLVGKYDRQKRRGFNLLVQSLYGVTSAQPNYRNLFFGIDDGQPPRWRDCGRPGECTMVWALCVYDGHLYAGTFESERDGSGHVYRYEGDDSWVDCGSPHPSNAITSLTVYRGRLYVAASHYRSSGSSLPESENTIPGGRIFRFDGRRWSDCGRIGGAESVGGMAVFRDRLYASSMYAPPGLFRYEGSKRWVDCGNPEGRIEALGVFRGHLYGSGWDEGRGGVYRFDGSGWTDCGTAPGNTQTYSFAVYKGGLHIGTWPSGRVFEMGADGWEDRGQLGEEREVMGMLVYNGKLYAGTLPSGSVYRLDGKSWTPVGQIDSTPGVRYRRVWSMAIFGGRLFCGTLPSGHVHALEAGKSVTHDYELPQGWQHVVALRRDGWLELYLNGALVSSSAFPDRCFDITNSLPLTIGFGSHDYFSGSLRDLRLYGRALERKELLGLCRDRPPRSRG